MKIRNEKGQFISGIPLKFNVRYKPEIHSTKITYCACGCGGKIIYKPVEKSRKKQSFIRGHNLRILTDKQRKQMYANISKSRKNNGVLRTTPLYKLIKVSKEYKEWREGIFKRDNYNCQKCSEVGGKLNAHHIKPFAFIYKEAIQILDEEVVYSQILQYQPLFDIKNGITLCRKCHTKEKHSNYKTKPEVFVNGKGRLL